MIGGGTAKACIAMLANTKDGKVFQGALSNSVRPLQEVQTDWIPQEDLSPYFDYVAVALNALIRLGLGLG